MAEISAADVAKLREMTSAGYKSCREALAEAQGDFSLAVDLLRKRGKAISAGKSGRAAKDGIIVRHILPGARLGILVEVNCETDFVARNEEFRAFCEQIARTLAENPQADLDPARTAQVAKMGENILISRHHRMEVQGVGMVAAYIHTGSKIGVLVEVGAGKEETIAQDSFKEFVRDLTLQVAAANPTIVSREQADPAVIDKEKEIAAEQAKGKPPQAISRIVEGKLEKFYQTYCLLDQGFVKRNSEITVKEHLATIASQLADTIQIRRFVRFQVGEAAA